MVNLSKLNDAIIEKQEIILNHLTELSHKELIKMMASISAIISNLEKMQTQEDVKCCKIIAEQFLNDSRASFAKAEALMKSSDAYLSYKNILNLKQCALRELQLVKIQIQYSLKVDLNDEQQEIESSI